MWYAYIFVLVIAFIVHLEGKTYYNSRINDNKCNPKVYDFGHKYLPNLSRNTVLPVILNIVPFIPFVFGISFAKEYSSYFIIIFCLRVLFNLSTILPKHKDCNDGSYTLYNMLFGHCYDKVFSGHFASSVLISLLLVEKGIIPDVNVHIAFNVFYGLLILMLRWHYSIDLLVAFAVTMLVYQNKLQLIL